MTKLAPVVCIGIWLFLAIGWVMNIVKILNNGFEIAQWGGVEFMRVVGIFLAPLGGILGWF